MTVAAHASANVKTKGTIPNPKLWGPPPQQKPQRYVAVTKLTSAGTLRDSYETRFGVRTLKFDPNQGFFVNGQHVKMNGVCNHHDVGALGAALNFRTLERQFEIMAEMGVNAIRTAHNPPAPELLDLADRFGLVIMDEAFDVWATGKAKLDHHLFFPEWHEQDLRALIRRDRNHPSVVMWSIGNEIPEQNDSSKGPAMAKELNGISHIGVNYQGTGVRSGPAQYPTYHSSAPGKFIVGTETASTLSSRGVYTFPVVAGRGTPATASAGIASTVFPSKDRAAFSGKALVIVRGQAGKPGAITVTAAAPGLTAGTIAVTAQ